MPSSSARQRNKRALASSATPSKLSKASSSSSGRSASSGSRLPHLLSILLLTTVLLVGLQALRFYYRGPTAFRPLEAWTKAKYSSLTNSNQPSSASAPAAPAIVPGQGVVDHDVVEDGDEMDGELEAQFDDDGNLDMATVQRMLDLLYKRPDRNAAGAAGRVVDALIQDEGLAEEAELEDEAI